ncbi:UDP-N-acetylmuramate--L-alanine ligase [Caldisericum exile]|uniref:UDP-N-acetylmuramate--L-alanine ligase n=1 Tax=Caldisericum exile (strain DSM 21853 / NBRC 104410 / AZM16c01) TaxID=511051 RepID=A0A7U6JF18_CALEA|nr:UDP-N-acetylmuramate--L-alanine ligase [Caldisericum exile]BAL81306.1 UDP-N-acetylmuramate--L-alanine ligase [Caldisericum exile AZM16c01]
MKKVLLLGVAGVGMKRLAEIYMALGYKVLGIDMKENETTHYLKGIGVDVNPKEFEVDKSIDKVIFSSAIRKDDFYLLKAKELGIPIERRGEALANIAKDYKSIVVAGTHGKTTTTSLISEILSKRIPVNAYIGGDHKQNGRFLPSAEYFVIESDESDKTFLLFKPHIGVVTNIDKDHLNAYDWDFENLKNAFFEFMEHSEMVVVNKDDKPSFEVSERLSKTPFYYSIKDTKAHATIIDYSFDKDGISFRAKVLEKNSPLLKLNVFGVQNLSNALASILVGRMLNISFDEIEASLMSFSLPKRRLEYKGNVKGIHIFDDHADHPTEVEATLNALRTHFPRSSIIAIFQPHRYTRVFSLKETIAKPFYLADFVIVLPIYSAFENPIEGITNEKVFDWIKTLNPNKNVFFASKFETAADLVSRIAKPGDIVITLGPGDVYLAIDTIMLKLRGEK